MILNGATIEISKVNAYSNFGYMDSYNNMGLEIQIFILCNNKLLG